MKTKSDIRRLRLISSIVAGVILTGFFVAVGVSVSNTDAPLTDDVGGSATVADSAVSDAVSTWNSQTSIIYTVTQSLPVGESALSAASALVTSDSFGDEVTIEWTDGTYEQYTDITSGNGVGVGVGWMPDGSGIASNPNAFSPNAQINDQGMITLS